MQKLLMISFLSASALGSPAIAAGLDDLSKSAPATKPEETKPSTGKAKALDTPTLQDAASEPAPSEAKTPAETNKAKPDEKPAEDTVVQEKAAEPKKPSRSASSKSLDNRLSLLTSVGWAVVKPANGTWNGLGSSDFGFRWRMDPKAEGNLFITGRYAPFAGVWTVGSRDYDATLHGLYAGAEYHAQPSFMKRGSLKANVELGYMLVYAKAQDKAVESGDVKGGKANLSVGGGAEWSVVSDKFKIGPFARVHVAGFSIVNVGGSAQFVF